MYHPESNINRKAGERVLNPPIDTFIVREATSLNLPKPGGTKWDSILSEKLSLRLRDSLEDQDLGRVFDILSTPGNILLVFCL